MRIFFILIATLYPYYLYSKVINLHYEIDWNSIHLADIFWDITIDSNEYEIDFLIKSYGLTDKIYKYESLTSVNGYIQDKHLRPLNYSSKTKSSNQDVYSNIEFDNYGKITSFDISKNINEDQVQMQKEILEKYLYFTDPISQISQYFLNQSNSDRVILDGLNIYKLISEELPSTMLKESNPTVYTGEVNILKITFPFFKGLHKMNKKNNLKEIKMYNINIQKTNIPAKYDIISKKFNAKLYLKNFEINE
tara:strand:- start:4148 stop:4897 length:750 start_codon:yes stop_codon:yes gene_type:complete